MSKPSQIRRWSPLLAALAVLLVAGSASAAEPVRYTAEKKLRLHIDTDLFSWTQGRDWYTPENRPDVDTHDRINIIGFGAMRPLLIDRASGGAFDFGTGAIFAGGSMFALGMGYGIHRHVILGARLGLSFDRLRGRSDNDVDGNYTAYRFFGAVFTPYIEVLPIAEGRVLPYFLFRTGVAGAAFGTYTQAEFAGQHVDGLSRDSGISPLVGVGAGAHFFLIPQFSLDLGLNFDYRWIFARNLTRMDGATTKTDWERSSQAFNLGLNLGLSVWFF